MVKNKKLLKKLHHERKMTEQQRAKQEASFGLEQITQEQINGMLTSVLAEINARIQAVLETDSPEALLLMGPDFPQTVKHFSDAGKSEILKQAIAQCKEECEAFGVLAILSWIKTNASTETQ